jgi:membrane protease YdiL (CAAX protease family)
MKLEPHFNDLLIFIKKPARYSVNLTVNDKVKNTIRYFYLYAFIGMFCSGLLNELFTQLKLFESESKMEQYVLEYSILYRYLIIVLIGPFIEELIFRYPLKYFQNRTFYKYFVYLSALLFGLTHFDNYTTSSNAVYFILFLIAPQIWGGLVMSYVRINYGFWYSFLLHCCVNFIGVSLITIFHKP